VLQAQPRELTLVAGANLSGASGPVVGRSEARSGFQAGLSLRFARGPRLSLQSEVMLVQRRIYGERGPGSPGPISDAANLLYFQIPVLFRFQQEPGAGRGVRPFLVVGPFVAIRLHCGRELTESDGNVRHIDCSVTANNQVGNVPYFAASYQEVDAGLLGELGVEIHRFSLRVRGEKSLNDLVAGGVVRTTPLERAKLWSGSFSVEYLLRVL
jgi:hypothetical protein